MVYLDMTPTTIGQQAERNEKRGGEKYEAWVEQKKQEQKAKEEATPWWREKGEKPLDTSKIKDVNKYILTGDKD